VDIRAKTLDFIYWTAWARPDKKAKRFFHAKSHRVNQEAIARAMGVSSAQISRVLHGKQKPESDFTDGLKRLSGVELDSDLWGRIEDAPPAPPGAYGSIYP
jgi:hypothetical protein